MYVQFLTRYLKPVFDAPTEGTPAAAAPPAGDPPTDTPAEPAPAEPSLISGEGEPPAEPADGKPAEPPATETEPITMEAITLPDNLTIPEGAQEGFLETINDQSLSRADLVNKLIEMQGQALESAKDAQVNEWVETRTAWKKEAEALPEIGGEKFKETLASIKSGLDAVGATKEAYAALDVTGAGDNPHIIQLFHKLVQPFLEKQPPSGQPDTKKADLAQRMYPSMHKG